MIELWNWLLMMNNLPDAIKLLLFIEFNEYQMKSGKASDMNNQRVME